MTEGTEKILDNLPEFTDDDNDECIDLFIDKLKIPIKDNKER